MTRLFLHYWNVSATFRIWQKQCVSQYVSSHFLTLAIELHLVHFGLGASFTFELYCSLPSTPSLLLFRFTKCNSIAKVRKRKYAILFHLSRLNSKKLDFTLFLLFSHKG